MRLAFEATRVALRVTEGAVKLPFRIAGALLGRDGKVEAPPAREPASPQPKPEPAHQPESAPPHAATAPAPRPEPIELEPEEPVHIDDEPELVAEFAEPGAEDGAGPEIHVEEPWDGYRRMRVGDIQARIAKASPAEAAVVQLYEMTHRKRRSVLDAVERRTKQLANAPNGR